MYLLFGILFALCILFFIIYFYRRTFIIRKICCMSDCEKLNLLNDLIEPFGFCYLPDQDMITSTLHPWQKKLGYRSLYDQSTPRFNMVFDCEPIYFDYGNHTWLIEFWKGQYGINLGGEVGIYKAETRLEPGQYQQANFCGVSDSELLPVSISLNHKGTPLFSICRSHWWLTGFKMGCFCEPENLTMDISIVFPKEEMLFSFTNSLRACGYHPCEICIDCLMISFSFSLPHTRQPRHLHRFHSALSQWENEKFSKFYRFITQPFSCTLDRMLYLYFFLPAAFRHMVHLRKKPHPKFQRKHRSK